MSQLVVDSSVAVKWYLPEAGSSKARELLRILGSEGQLAAPDFILTEISSVLWKYVRRQVVYEDEAQLMLQWFREAGVQLFATGDLAPLTLRIALTTGCTVYDSTYLAVATMLNCPLITADERLCRSAAIGPFSHQVVLLDHWQPPTG